MSEHPLTRLYLDAARTRSHTQMRIAMDMARSIEKATDAVTIAQCKLAAEVLLERKLAA